MLIRCQVKTHIGFVQSSEDFVPLRDLRARGIVVGWIFIHMSDFVFIALGSNQGVRAKHLRLAARALSANPRLRIIARSRVYETEPWGGVATFPFLNQIFQLTTNYTPHELLANLQTIERSRGRKRAQEVRWGNRTLDLDILFFGTRILHSPSLTIPHPRLHERAFILRILQDMGKADFLHPMLEKSITELFAQLEKKARVCLLP